LKKGQQEKIFWMSIFYKLSANEMTNCRGKFCLRDDKTEMNFVEQIAFILHVIAVTPNVSQACAVRDLEALHCLQAQI
jgi:hypothetical protein